jgi:hypothetical protein
MCGSRIRAKWNCKRTALKFLRRFAAALLQFA